MIECSCIRCCETIDKRESECEQRDEWLHNWRPADRSAEFDAIDWERVYEREVSRG